MNSNITSVEDAVHTNYGHVYTMDDLNRVIGADRGVASGGSITTPKWEQSWGLSQTGNWLTELLDLEADSSPEIDSTNTFSNANEWDDIDIDSTGGPDYTLVYDEVGNLTDDDRDYEYLYDPFGRLRKVIETGTSDVVAEYRYNGLNQRITTHFDTDADNDVDGSDTISHFAYDARWRTVARYEDTDTDPTEQWVHHHAGLVESGSSSYIDSVILRDRDTTANGTLNERVYYLQNWRADVVALITDTGEQVEQIRYEPYGTPFGLPKGDSDSDGDYDASDVLTGSYDVRKDVNMDGSITFADTTAAIGSTGYQTLARGVASSPSIDNRKGYAGYEHLAELAGAKYDVRYRVYFSELGTWSRRDPLVYVDGMNLYAYSANNPQLWTDPLGLNSCVQGGPAATLDCIVSSLMIAGKSQPQIIRALLAMGFSAEQIAALFGLTVGSVLTYTVVYNQAINHGVTGTLGLPGRRSPSGVDPVRDVIVPSCVISPLIPVLPWPGPDVLPVPYPGDVTCPLRPRPMDIDIDPTRIRPQEWVRPRIRPGAPRPWEHTYRRCIDLSILRYNRCLTSCFLDLSDDDLIKCLDGCSNQLAADMKGCRREHGVPDEPIRTQIKAAEAGGVR